MTARIVIQAVGAVEDNGDLRFPEFIEQLNAVRVALRHTERLVTGTTEARVYYRVVDLHKASPATVVLEPKPLLDPDATITQDYSGSVVDTFLANLRHIMTHHTMPQHIDMPAAEAYINLGVTVEKHVAELVITDDRERITIARGFKSVVETALGPDEICEGSITGTLDQVNLHRGTRRFFVYPFVGPVRVSCDFPPALRGKVKEGLDNYVRVIGELRYKKFDPFPYAVTASDIEILPPEEQLPTLLDIRGMAPDATKNLTTEEFLASIRDDDW